MRMKRFSEQDVEHCIKDMNKCIDNHFGICEEYPTYNDQVNGYLIDELYGATTARILVIQVLEFLKIDMSPSLAYAIGWSWKMDQRQRG